MDLDFVIMDNKNQTDVFKSDLKKPHHFNDHYYITEESWNLHLEHEQEPNFLSTPTPIGESRFSR